MTAITRQNKKSLPLSAQEQFFTLLSAYPYLAPLWDKERRTINVDAFEHALGTLSSGEVQMAKFFAAVWFGENTRYGFDLVDAVSRLDAPDIQNIIDWINRPFWP